MTLLDTIGVALRMLWANRLRSALTTLGMIIGVGSVILLVAFGQGAVRGVEDQIRGLGTNLVFVLPGVAPSGGQAAGGFGSAQSVTLADANALASANLAGTRAVVPQLSVGAQLISPDGNVRTQVIGTTASYADVRSTVLDSGSFFTEQDVSRGALRAVLGADLAKTLFASGGAVGQRVRMTFGNDVSFNFVVAGVAAARGGGFLSGDNDVYVPLTALQARLGALGRNAKGQIYVNQITVQTAVDANQADVKAAITDLLAARHAVATPDFTVQTQDDLLGTISLVSAVLTVLLGSIAGISLLVGGIGVMNIMLVSVTERTREIGIRLAIGAEGRDIIEQFVTEALTLTLFGGIAGVLFGTLTALWLNGKAVAGQTLATNVQPWSVALAFAVSVLIGVMSGLYPAWRASRLDPITALRSD